MSGADTLKTYVPDFITQSKTFQAVYNSQGPELDNLQSIATDIVNQCFVGTATWGLDIWENTLGIPTVPGKPYDQRKSLIISKLRGVGTVNAALIQSISDSYSDGNVSVAVDTTNYTVTVTFNDIRGIPQNVDDIQTVLASVLPAHLSLTFKFTYTLVGDLINWNTKISALISARVTVGQLMTWQA
jgi:uncharacterized protein YmfQ (DUF2313 family)